MYVNRLYKSDPSSPYSDVKVEKLTVKGQSEVKTFVSENDLRNNKVVFDPEAGKGMNKSNDPRRLKIATRAAKEVSNGMNVNLGIGIPTLLPSVLPEDVHINLES